MLGLEDRHLPRLGQGIRAESGQCITFQQVEDYATATVAGAAGAPANASRRDRRRPRRRRGGGARSLGATKHAHQPGTSLRGVPRPRRGTPSAFAWTEPGPEPMTKSARLSRSCAGRAGRGVRVREVALGGGALPSGSVVSSDRLRALVGSGEHDFDESADAFALLDQIVAARLRRGLTAVVDTLGLDSARRLSYLELARSSGMPAVAVLVDADPVECRRRNRARDRPVPAAVLEGQLRRMRAAAVEIPRRGMGPGDNRQASSARGLAHAGREDGGQPAGAAAGPDGPGAAAVAISLG